jgi:hypothetical protein
MECSVLSDPAMLSELIKELDGAKSKAEYEAFFACIVPSIEEPGRQKLSIIPRDIRAGANPSLWVKENSTVISSIFSRSIVHCDVIFAGQLPQVVEHTHIQFTPSDVKQRDGTVQSRPRPVRREIRLLSGPSHLWVDRLRLHTDRGDIDNSQRGKLLTDLATQYWTPSMEKVYVPPSLRRVEGCQCPSEKALQLLTNRKPTCPERGLTVLYGPGGIGKTFFLQCLAEALGVQAKREPLASIPVFVRPPTLLHGRVLETWLSQHGFGRLTLQQISVLLKYGLVIPIVDALDELVKGEARQGSRDFLVHFNGLMCPPSFGRGVLACRDYYLNSDSLVPDIVRGTDTLELAFGFFDRQERRRFLQARTGLEASHASRWATVLEEQASTVLGARSVEDIEALIGHPIVLDSLAKYVEELPAGRRVTDVEEFKITSPHIFGHIVEQLLRRERDKTSQLWRETFGDRLAEEWLEPMEPHKQRLVLKEMTLLVARDGGEEVEHKACQNDAYRDLKHGIFMFTKEVPRSAGNPTEALQFILADLMGMPTTLDVVHEEESDSVRRQAIRHLAENYSSHILANTEAGLPSDLVFALRHRAYFDYFLSDALVDQLERALSSRNVQYFMEWCRQHHVYDDFGTCLDFLLWDPRVVKDGMDSLFSFLKSAKKEDDVLAGHLVSLALTLFLRRGEHRDGTAIEGMTFAPFADWELLLVREMLPESVSHLIVRSCSFPDFTIDRMSLRYTEIESVDFETLRVVSSHFTQSRLVGIECGRLCFTGTVIFSECSLDIATGCITIEPGSKVEFYDCEMNESLHQALCKDESVMGGVKQSNTTVRCQAPGPPGPPDRGYRFITKLMRLLRREGRAEFAVYEYKLRDRTPGTDEQYAAAMSCLVKHGCVEKRRQMVVMTDEGARHMYPVYSEPEVDYEAHKEYWGPIVDELNEILEPRPK